MMAIAYPIQPGMLHKIVKFSRDSNFMEPYKETLRKFGIRHETWFLQATENDGGVFISVWDAERPAEALQRFQASSDPFVTMLKQHQKIGTGLDPDQRSVAPAALRLPAGPASLLFDW